MKRQILTIALTTLGGMLVLGMGLWRLRTSDPSQIAHSVIVRDRSDSVKSGCDCTAALVKRSFVDANAGSGSTIVVTVTGDAASAGEPKLLTSGQVPTTRQALEGREAIPKLRAKMADDIKAACNKQPHTTVSPIFIAVKRAVEHLRALGCGKSSECKVFVQSDLEETSDSQIKAAINSTGDNKVPLPEPVNNDGIKIIISGVAETAGESAGAGTAKRPLTPLHNPQRADQIHEVWSKLFTNPERLTFEPYCPKN